MAYSFVTYTSTGSQNYNVPFPYLDVDHVKVYISGVATSAFTWSDAATVHLTSAPAVGATILIKRETPRDGMEKSFAAQPRLKGGDLDEALLQVYYIGLEGIDGADPSFMAPYIGAAEAAQAAAELAEANAAAAESAAAGYAGSSQMSAGDAQTAQDLAETAQGLAEAARDKAQDWAEETEDVPVETGKYSAKHWAAKAEDSAQSTQAPKLDDCLAPDDNTDLNVSTSAHGLCPKLSGNANDALKGDGSWGAAGGAPGGNDTYVQFNDSGALGGDAGLVYNKTTNKLTCSNDVEAKRHMEPACYNNGDSGSATTIDWTNGQSQCIVLTGSPGCTLTFSNPQPGSIRLLLQQGTGGSKTATWPTIYWAGGVAPALSTAAGALDIITLYYTGNTYFGMWASGFATV